MKKIITAIALVILVFSGNALFAQPLSGWWTFGNFGINYYSGEESETKMVVGLDLPSFYFMHNDTGLTLSVSPYHVETFCEQNERKEKANRLESFINLKLGLDLAKEDREWDIMPYVSLNWDPIRDVKNYRAEGGFDLTLYMPADIGYTFPMRMKVATLNFGYGLRRDNTYFTAGMSFDVLGVLYVILSSEYSEVSKTALPAVPSRGLEKAPVQPDFTISKAGLTGVRNRLYDELREWSALLNRNRER